VPKLADEKLSKILPSPRFRPVICARVGNPEIVDVKIVIPARPVSGVTEIEQLGVSSWQAAEQPSSSAVLSSSQVSPGSSWPLPQASTQE